jgi:hypothetical protein
MPAQRLIPVKQNFAAGVLHSVFETAEQECSRLLETKPVLPGETVAIAVGSRGIANLPQIVAAMVEACRKRGLKPFLVPAMGSHGGATPAGQSQVLHNLGIEATVLHVEIRAEMETLLLGTTVSGLPVHCAQAAAQADHVLLCNRVKPHTRFTGPVQSGLQKMLLIGLGKHAGAAACHRIAHHVPFEQLIAEALPIILGQVPVLGGLAILENAAEQTAHIQAISAGELSIQEPRLLQQAIDYLPRLPIRDIDLLIVDEIGKEISGTGLDTNIVGRKYNDHVSTPQDWCQTRLIYVRGLTTATAGNATGIGMTEFTHAGVVEQVDWTKTAINCITAGHPTAAMCPVVLEHDRAVLEAATSIVGHEPRIVHLRNTLHLGELFISENCLPDVQHGQAELTWGTPIPITFSAAGWFSHSL